jgi:hypothetical protein
MSNNVRFNLMHFLWRGPKRQFLLSDFRAATEVLQN